MKITIDLKWIKIETETSKNQMAMFMGFLIFVLEVVNLATAKYDMSLLQWIVVALAGLGGYTIGRKKG